MMVSSIGLRMTNGGSTSAGAERRPGILPAGASLWSLAAVGSFHRRHDFVDAEARRLLPRREVFERLDELPLQSDERFAEPTWPTPL